MVALPSQLFYNTMIPACLWFLARNKTNGGYRKRDTEILFIDARNMGQMISRRNRELSEDDLKTINDTYHNWRNIGGKYEDIPGYCKAATLEEVKAANYVLTPGRYVGAAEIEDDGIPFEDKLNALTTQLSEQFAQSAILENRIRKNLKGLGYEL
jgi:type I restriction enzyme M protein